MGDKYSLECNGTCYLFKKNNILHREAGPAIVFVKHKNKHLDLGDLDLYKKEPYKDLRLDQISRFYDLIKNNQIYYLDGINYTEKEFNSLILSNKLEQELPSNNIDTKKLKI